MRRGAGPRARGAGRGAARSRPQRAAGEVAQVDGLGAVVRAEAEAARGLHRLLAAPEHGGKVRGQATAAGAVADLILVQAAELVAAADETDQPLEILVVHHVGAEAAELAEHVGADGEVRHGADRVLAHQHRHGDAALGHGRAGSDLRRVALEKPDAAEHGVGFAHQQRGHDRGELARQPDVVGIAEGDERATSEVDGAVIARIARALARVADHGEAGLVFGQRLRHGKGVVLRAVLDDDRLPVDPGLTGQALNRGGQGLGCVVGRDDDGDQGHGLTLSRKTSRGPVRRRTEAPAGRRSSSSGWR